MKKNIEQNAKVYLLFLMKNIGLPVRFEEIEQIAWDKPFLNGLNLELTFFELLQQNLIRVAKTVETVEYYEITGKGSEISNALSDELPEELLKDTLKSALRFRSKASSDMIAETEISEEEHSFHLTVNLTENKKTVLSFCIPVDSKTRCEQYAKKIQDNPAHIYRGILALLNGDMDILAK